MFKSVYYQFLLGELEETTRTPSYYVDQDLKSNNLALNEAIDVAQNRPLWRLMSTFGAVHSWWCMPEKKKKMKSCPRPSL